MLSSKSQSSISKFKKNEKTVCLNKDFILVNLGIFYIMFPILLFFVGFLKSFYSCLLIIILLYCWFKCIKTFDFINWEETINAESNSGRKYFFISLIIVTIWVYFSGIGGFSFQNEDYIVRNAVFRDLIQYRWPIIFWQQMKELG